MIGLGLALLRLRLGCGDLLRLRSDCEVLFFGEEGAECTVRLFCVGERESDRFAPRWSPFLTGEEVESCELGRAVELLS